MFQLKQCAGYVLLGINLASVQSHASIIQSMTIEEIGVASGGLGTSSDSSGGGTFRFLGNSPVISFGSVGSTDGAVLMGTTQGNSAFTPGFSFINPSMLIKPNTTAGAPSAMVDSMGNLVLDLSGWGVNITLGLGYFPLSPDVGTLITSVAVKDATSYFYTADWSHQITFNDDPNETLVGFTTIWHLEGIAHAAAVPEPDTGWLVGTALLGLLGFRLKQT